MESFRKTLTAQFKCQYDERSEDNFASLMKNYHDSKDKIKTRRQLEKDLMNERLEERLHQRNSTKSEPVSEIDLENDRRNWRIILKYSIAT